MKTPSNKQLENGTFKLVNERWYKRCTGPAHEEPVYLPATTKYFYLRKTTDDLTARCRLCTNWDKLKSPGSYHGYVDIAQARPYYEEAINRIGTTELARRTGVSLHSIQNVLYRRVSRVQKRNLRKVMLELISLRRKGEFTTTSNSLYWRHRQKVNGQETCPACGTPLQNMTRDCKSCYDRHFRWFKSGKITKEEWEAKK